MNIKTEVWGNTTIRFVEKEPGDWWAVLADIAGALDLKPKRIKERLSDDVVSTDLVKTGNDKHRRKMLIVNEFGIYEAVFESRKKEAKEFKRWVFEILKALRQATGLEGFQIFRMLDKGHQQRAMDRLKGTLVEPCKVDYIKANTIANKAVSSVYGYPKMLKKGDMSPSMLMERQKILDDTVDLMSVNVKFGLGLSVSETVYGKYVS